MNRLTQLEEEVIPGVPHVRGDEPDELGQFINAAERSPRAWG